MKRIAAGDIEYCETIRTFANKNQLDLTTAETQQVLAAVRHRLKEVRGTAIGRARHIGLLTVAFLLAGFFTETSPACWATVLPAGGQKLLTLASGSVMQDAPEQTARAPKAKLGAAGNSGNARSISPKYIAALYGETAGESYACKLATAQALLNRGTLRGVYGKDSKLLRQKINARAWADCVRAISEAGKQPDLTRGATFWASKQDLGKPYLRGLICTTQVGGHWFFSKKV